MHRLNLNEGWKLHEAPLDWGRYMLPRVLRYEDGWLDCKLPCDIHMPLQEAGIIRDVVSADYCYDAEWTEHRSWWFVREFEGSGVDLEADVIELTLEGLDAYADVFLNGQWLGTHESTHYPFTHGVKDAVIPGTNTVAVRLTTGMEQVNDAMLAEMGYHAGGKTSDKALNRQDPRRVFVRKPQYTVGWDWGPKALTCGIVKDVYIKTYRNTAIRGVHVATAEVCAGGVCVGGAACAGCDDVAATARLNVALEVEQLSVTATRSADISVAISFEGKCYAELKLTDVLLTSGINFIDGEIELQDAKLWWPAGYGDQPLYTVDVRVLCQWQEEAYPAFEYGVRHICLDTSRMDMKEDTRLFALYVNGVRVYCKGGDWIPSDSIYARVTKEKYETLISEARCANFNMLRIWGGGCYEYDIFYQLCDRAGILLWHDFMFACAVYPDHLDSFTRECRAELDYQTQRLRNHACIGLFSGNNEDHWIFEKYQGMRYEKQHGLRIANVEAKRVIRMNCKNIPFWNSSPYGGDTPNANNIGNVHHWHACMMNEDMAKRIEPKEYDKVGARFVAEYGYPGPCPMDTIRDYFDGKPIERGGAVWDLHNNEFEKRTVNAGIEKHYLDNAAALPLEDYILYAGMVQGTMLGYSLEAIRFKDYASGSLFWMYNDTWGEVGWTIVDYYLRRKISFYGVRRAFAPVKLTLRAEGGRVKLQGLNDTPDEISLPGAMCGYMPFDGGEAQLSPCPITLPPRSREYVFEIALPYRDYTRGAFVVLTGSDAAPPAVLRSLDARELQLPGAAVEVLKEQDAGADKCVTLTTKAYVHGVYFADEAYKASDNYFDLLPGQVKTVTLYGAAGKSVAWRTVR